MSDSRKTKKELIEELNALREELQDKSGSGEDVSGSEQSDDSGVTRREVLSAWVAPVILSVPLAPRLASAQEDAPGVTFVPTPFAPTSMSPTNFPTNSPTPKPTPKPTAPTPKPTFPTAMPTVSPTASPTAFPTASPTKLIPVEMKEFDVE